MNLVVLAAMLAASAAPSPHSRQTVAPPPLVPTQHAYRLPPPRGGPRRATFGQWAVDDGRDFIVAATSNWGYSQFGLLCGARCVVFFAEQRSCRAGQSYPMLINSAAGPRTLSARCISVDASANVLALDDLDPERLFGAGGQLVIATPFDSNEVALSYFSLDGAMQAIRLAATTSAQTRPPSQPPLRDFTR